MKYGLWRCRTNLKWWNTDKDQLLSQMEGEERSWLWRPWCAPCSSKAVTSQVAGAHRWAFHTERRAWGLHLGPFHQSNPGLSKESRRMQSTFEILWVFRWRVSKSKIFRSNFIEFCNNQYSHHLIKWTTDAEAPFIWTPVQTGNGLGRQRNILQKADGTRNSHLYSFGIFLWPLNRVFAESKNKEGI